MLLRGPPTLGGLAPGSEGGETRRERGREHPWKRILQNSGKNHHTARKGPLVREIHSEGMDLGINYS